MVVPIITVASTIISPAVCGARLPAVAVGAEEVVAVDMSTYKPTEVASIPDGSGTTPATR
ncbi:hypothetical protein GCM10009722_09950 [Williamsia deligens]